MSVLRALVLRPLAREPLRSILTILGIAVGVGVIVAIELSNQSALRAFRESVDAVAGRANYQIVSDSAIDESLLLRLQPFWNRGVRFAPVLDVEGIIEPSQAPIRLLGVDLLSDLHFRDYRYAQIQTGGAKTPGSAALDIGPGTASAMTYLDLFRSDSIVVPAPFARENHLRIGSPLTINLLGHRSTMVVRGILESRGPGSAFSGSMAVADIAATQSSFGLRGRLTRIDLIIPEAAVADLRKMLPPNVRIERPARRNERVENMLRAFRVNLFALAGVALLVGMFLVYNTVLISILRRRKDVGILKTLGVSPLQIFAAFTFEGLLFGVLGSALGIVFGSLLASGILKLIGRTINALYVTSAPENVVLTPDIIALGAIVGTLLSLISAIQPSIEAARVRPTLLIRPGLQQRIERRQWRALALWACLSFLAALGAARIPPAHGIAIGGYLSVLFVVSGFSLLAPAIIQTLARLSTPILSRMFGVVGRLAPGALSSSLRRTAVAGAALALATGMMIAVALMVGSFRETVRQWVDQTVSSDLWLRPSKGLTNAQRALFPREILDDLARVPLLAAIDPVRGKDVTYQDSIVGVGSSDFEVAAKFGDLPMIRPSSAAAALAAARRTGGVLVSESFAIKYHRGVGDFVALTTAHGSRRFPVTGVYRDYSSDRGAVVMDRGLYIREFEDDAVNTVILYVNKGVTIDAARRALETTVGPKYHAFTVTNGEIRREVMTIFDQTFLITYALLAVAIVVAVLGIINTLSALILERTRELALLRVVGMTVRELGQMLVLESSLLGFASCGTGLVMGYVLSWILINVINKQSFGWTIQFHTPVRLIVLSLSITFVSSMLAGLVPSRLAGRIRLASALKSE